MQSPHAVPAEVRIALSLRQPWAELILRGVKTAEFRKRPTKVVGVPFYLYAAKSPGPADVFEAMNLKPGALPTGVLVGVATIRACRRARPGEAPAGYEDCWAWDLADVRRLSTLVAPQRHPQPTWFRPFERERPRRAA